MDGPSPGSVFPRTAPSPGARSSGSATCGGATARGSERSHSSPARPSALLDHGQRASNLDLVPLDGDDRLEHARDGRVDFVVRLLGFDLDDRLAGRDGFTLALEPAGDGGVLHLRDDLREVELVGHQSCLTMRAFRPDISWPRLLLHPGDFNPGDFNPGDFNHRLASGSAEAVA